MANEPAYAETSVGIVPADVVPDLALLLDTLPDGVYGVDAGGRTWFVNQAATKMLGYDAEELIGKVAHDLIHHSRPDGSPYPAEQCALSLASREGRRFHSDEDCFWRKDGTSFPVEYHSCPLWREGALIGFVVTFRDLTERRRAEERARQLVREQFARAKVEFQAAQLRDALAQAPALICITRGPRHVIESVNDAFRTLVGERDVIGKPLRDAFPDADESRIAAMDRAFETGEPYVGHDIPAVIAGPTGPQERFFNFVYQPLRDSSGLIYGLMTHAVDVSEQTLARRSLELRTQLATLMANVGMVLSRGGALRDTLQECAELVVRHADAAFARIWTLAETGDALELQASAGIEMPGNGTHDVVPVGQVEIGFIAQERTPYITNSVAGDPRVGDSDSAQREGMVSFAGYPLLVGHDLVGVLAMFARHPLSDADLQALAAVSYGVALGIQRHRAEEALRRRAQELTEIAGALERSNRELDAFAYAASHDLRAPLRGIANLAQWIEEDLHGKIGAETAEMLQLLRSRMHRMEALIEGILQYSRAGRVHEPPVPVDTSALVEESLDLLSADATANVTIHEDLPVVLAERHALQQVFLNLISNALKHGGDFPDIEIGVRDGGAHWQFFVRDAGPGIAPEFHEKIWGIFQTLEARDIVEGSGIGLALVKKLVETHGGRAWVESAPGAGATFWFEWRKGLDG